MVIIDSKSYFAKAEQHQYQNEVTKYPVEKGSNVADHVIIQPAILNVESIVSDTPLVPVPDGVLPSNEALIHLRAIRENGYAVIIVTDLGTYDNMICTSLVIPRDGDTGRALRFTATFEQILLITNERTTVEVATPIAAHKKHLGHKKTQPGLVTWNGKPVSLNPITYFKKIPWSKSKIRPPTRPL